ncbi:MAG: hypothetical protein GF341_04420 [candidate division Zixibacteria bacterium]|nr:hypothetical protein [candidate division Zixibacteria bacterium]
MADITDPQAIAFSNEYLRPICEAARALRYRIDDLETRWFDGISDTIGNSAGDTLVDGRETLPPMTAEQITNTVANLFAARTALILDLIELPCVRPLDVTI